MKPEHVECYRRAQRTVTEMREAGKMDVVRAEYVRLKKLDLGNEEHLKEVRGLKKSEMIDAIALLLQEECAQKVRQSEADRQFGQPHHGHDST